MSSLESALHLLGLGVSVLPIKAGTKQPALRTWKRYQDERADNATARRWYAGKNATNGVGVVTGPISGNLCCRDFDTADGFPRWKSEHPKLAREVWVVESGTGHHVYARTERSFATKRFDDGEFRAAGAMTCYPPSVHPSGKRYVLLQGGKSLPPIIDPVAEGLSTNHPSETNTAEQHTTQNLTPAAPVTPETPVCHEKYPSEGYDSEPLSEELLALVEQHVLTGPNSRFHGQWNLLRELHRRGTSPAVVGKVFDAWWPKSMTFSTTTTEEAKLGFLAGYSYVRNPEQTLAKGRELALTLPLTLYRLDLMRAGFAGDEIPYARILALAEALQWIVGPTPFILASRDAAEIAWGDRGRFSQAATFLRTCYADRAGVLKLHKAGTPGGKLAGEYLYPRILEAVTKPAKT